MIKDPFRSVLNLYCTIILLETFLIIQEQRQTEQIRKYIREYVLLFVTLVGMIFYVCYAVHVYSIVSYTTLKQHQNKLKTLTPNTNIAPMKKSCNTLEAS